VHLRNKKQLEKIYKALDLFAIIEKRYKITSLENESGEIVDVSLIEKPP
jgi:hypothetical protein